MTKLLNDFFALGVSSRLEITILVIVMILILFLIILLTIIKKIKDK